VFTLLYVYCFIKMANDLTVLKVNMQELRTDVKYITESLDELKVEFKGFSEKCDNKYASKVTEKIVYGLVGGILIYFLGIIFNLIETH